MKKEYLVVGFIAIVVVAALIFIVATREAPQFARFKEVDLKLLRVNDSHVEIQFLFELERSKVLQNASIELKVYDVATNLLIEKRSIGLPEGNEVIVNSSFEKDRDYTLKIRLIKDGKILDARSLTLRNLDTLIPDEKNVKVLLKDVDFILLGSSEDRVSVMSRFYLESMYDYNVTFHVKVLQYESNVLAAEKWMQSKIEKGKTNLIEVEFEIPQNYNYLFKLEIWRNGSLLKSWSRPLNLAPTKKIPEGVKEEKVEFEVEKFVATPYYPQREKAPGFEIAIAALAIGIALRRYR